MPTLVLIAEHDPPVIRRCDELIGREVLDGRSVSIDADHVVNRAAPGGVRGGGPAVPDRDHVGLIAAAVPPGRVTSVLVRLLARLLVLVDHLLREVRGHLLVVVNVIENAPRPPVIERRSIT